MQASEIQQAVIHLQARIFKEKYFVDLWLEALKENNASTATIDQREEDPNKMVLLCHEFWEALPDSPSIRTGPFFDLCNIAENVFGFD